MTRVEAESLLTSTVLPMVRGMARSYRRRATGLSFGDLVQVGLVAAWKKLPQYDASTGFKLCTFLRHSILNAFREYHRNQVHPLGWRYNRTRKDGMAMPAKLDQPVDYRAQADPEDPADFERLIKPLRGREKAVMRMVYRSGMTHRSIASELHCSEATVQNLVRRSLAALRERWRAAA